MIANQRSREIGRMVFDFVVPDFFVRCGVDEGAEIGRMDAAKRRVVRFKEKVPDWEGDRN